MLNNIEKFKVAILHLNRNWNDCDGVRMSWATQDRGLNEEGNSNPKPEIVLAIKTFSQ